ncbi:MAG: hypothetical protein JXL97_19305 [Bacteroidales bacterium]|nr:hypothetical protein [Bacteroidales bacterium]
MKKNTILFAIAIITLFSCNRNEFIIDVSDIDVDLEIYRFDEQLFTIDPDEIYYEIPKIQSTYGEFFDIYNIDIIGVGMPEQKEYYENLSEFFYYCDQIGLYSEIAETFPPNNSTFEAKLADAFKHYKYYFPDKQIPAIITCVSGFNLSVFTGYGFIGISLDKYLGTNYEGYKEMFENYMTRRMHKEMIPVDVMKAWSMAEFQFNDSINTVMTNSIYEGRIQYFLDAMLPETADTLKWGYTQIQWGWANKYEKNIWNYMVSDKVVFSNETMQIKTYTGEAPFTTPFQNNSAPRAGSFIGYKIVQDYMKNNPDITLKDLMNERDYMKIYNNSYYKP